ncbi:hypothetical protein [Rhizobium paranaense]|uniref:Uncharacterized protein n=1 Tax=Rhizobium paranaense TaxID=1650438 RepID=A0A7W8XY20_9HYPH|nr:hypothetical protein [Rhizobium paranaense]MBB5577678.1 hypothetical protein [Rhizobium paranaense]
MSFVLVLMTMPVVRLDGQLSFIRMSLAPCEVPKLLERHRDRYKGSDKVEQRATKLIAGNFPAADSLAFIEAVCKLGRGQRNFSRIEVAGGARIAQSLASATKAIEGGDVTLAIGELSRLPHLGFSFASKVARFLAPDKCVVLDSVIRSRIGYLDSNVGYTRFLQDCFQLLQLLQQSSDLESTLRDSLRVCDVEAAVFMKAKEEQ